MGSHGARAPPLSLTFILYLRVLQMISEALLIVDANFFPDIQQLVASLPFTSCECECSPTISETYLRNTMQESRLKGELARKYKLILKNSLCFEKSPDTFHAGDVA
jgi:hypothetical protein